MIRALARLQKHTIAISTEFNAAANHYNISRWQYFSIGVNKQSRTLLVHLAVVNSLRYISDDGC